ncbi:hypothetical protein Smic_17790 [Streptomyces microflavus]|uniref:Uncharacterized protein n=1 Tax=Streptomyces microflavus TaxID=1919 RepID=A0A7J0CL59_STRMI|nr:hypothetical protein Smic_17790 [Streptomyces microflavus]
MGPGTGQRGVAVGGAGLGGPLHGGGEGEYGVEMDGAVGLPGTACGVQPLQGMGAGPCVEPGPQLGVGEVLQGLREQRVGSSGPHGGERPRPGPAGDGDLPEDEGGDPGAEEGGGGVPAHRARQIRVRRGRRVQALAEQRVPRLRASGEHRAHPGPVGGEGTVVRGGVDAAHGRQVAGRVAHHPGRLGRPEERVEGPPGVVRAEQRGRGEEGFMGIGGGPGTQGEQAVDVGGEAGRGGVLPRRPGPGQQGTGPGRVTGEGGLFGRRGEPGRAQGLFGGERGGAGEGRGAFGMRVRAGRGRLQPGGEHGVRAGGAASELDEGGERGGVSGEGRRWGGQRGRAGAGVRRAGG